MLVVIDYRILPFTLSCLFALALPTLEFWIALLLLTGTLVRFAAFAYAFLLLSFIVGVSVNLKRGRDLNCHCFGSKSKRKIGASLLMQDVLLWISACLLATLTPSWWTSEPWSFTQHAGLTPLAVPLILTAFSAILSIVLGSADLTSRITKLIPSLRKLAPIRARASHQGGSQ